MFGRVEYWLKDQSTQNFGDSLSRVLMDRLFLPAGSETGSVHVIGSVVDDSYVRIAQEVRPGTVPVFWGCGIRTPNGLSEANRRRVKILAVRGPVSAADLGVEGQVPTGDSALILPAIYQPARTPSYEGRSICIPHFSDTRSDDELLAISNCDAVVRPNIGPDLAEVYRLVDIIAAADFVLSASLHGAIVAAAYHRPFCFWDAGLPPDVPLKWEDFAASANFEPVFAATVADARVVYQKSIGPRIRLPALAPLVESAPFAVRSDAYRKVQAYDAANLSGPFVTSASSQIGPVNLAHELIGHLAARLNYGASADLKERASQKTSPCDSAGVALLLKRATELHEQTVSLLNDRNRSRRRFFQKVKFRWRAERYIKIIQRSGLFDEAWYRKTYADVGDKPINALRHYVKVGRFEGKNPNPYFDTNWYLWNYPHVLIAGTDPLTHYIRKGAREELNAGPDFDTSAYLRRFPELKNGNINPLYHFLTQACGDDAQEATPPAPVRSHEDIQNPGPVIVMIDETYPPPPDEKSGTADTANLIAQLLESGFRVVFIAHAQFHDPSRQGGWLDRAGVEVIDGSRYASIDAYILEEGSRADLILLSRIHVGGRSRPRVSARRS